MSTKLTAHQKDLREKEMYKTMRDAIDQKFYRMSIEQIFEALGENCGAENIVNRLDSMTFEQLRNVLRASWDILEKDKKQRAKPTETFLEG